MEGLCCAELAHHRASHGERAAVVPPPRFADGRRGSLGTGVGAGEAADYEYRLIRQITIASSVCLNNNCKTDWNLPYDSDYFCGMNKCDILLNGSAQVHRGSGG